MQGELAGGDLPDHRGLEPGLGDGRVGLDARGHAVGDLGVLGAWVVAPGDGDVLLGRRLIDDQDAAALAVD